MIEFMKSENRMNTLQTFLKRRKKDSAAAEAHIRR